MPPPRATFSCPACGEMELPIAAGHCPVCVNLVTRRWDLDPPNIAPKGIAKFVDKLLEHPATPKRADSKPEMRAQVLPVKEALAMVPLDARQASQRTAQVLTRLLLPGPKTIRTE